MAKRKTTFEDLVELVALMPWWTGVVLAVISYVLIHSFATQPVITAAGADNLSQVAFHQGSAFVDAPNTL